MSIYATAKDVTLKDAEKDEHGARLCISCAGLSDGGWDGETCVDEGLEYGEEEGWGEIGGVVEGERKCERGEEGIEGGEERRAERASREHKN